jgi:hypothetical protein
LQELLKFAALIHLAHDVAAADEFLLHIKLWNGRPVGKLLDALTNRVVFERVDACEADTEVRQDLGYRRREAALRKSVGSLS